MGVNDTLTPDSVGTLLLPPEAKDTMMTLAEQFEARGRAEGIARGKAEGERNVLLRLLAIKLGEVPETARQRIDAADEAELIRWAERVLSAGSVEDVLAE